MMARRQSRIRVGVAGFSYDDWYGPVYPARPPRGFDPLAFLAGFVDLVEINTSFYGPPRPEYARAWAERVAPHPRFRFTAKMWRRFTHDRDTAWTRKEADEIRAGLAPLRDADRLDAVLLQFPWSFRADERNSEWLADVRAEFSDFPLVVEVRHQSWNDAAFYRWLSSEGVGFVNIDQPLFRRSLAPSARATARVGYVRVHGRNYADWFRRGAGRDARYDYLYSPEELERWAERTREVARDDQVDEVDVVFNNHYRGQAVVNALELRRLLGHEGVRAPRSLGEAYGEELRALDIPVADAA